MSDAIDLQEFVGAFVNEADELTGAASASLLEIEAAVADGGSRPRAVRDLFRTLHTIKGLAGMIGVEPIVDLSHALETVVRDADRAGGHLGRDAIEVSLQVIAAIRERVRAVAEHRTVAAAPRALLDQIAGLQATPVAAPAPYTTPWDERLTAGERLQLVRALDRRDPVWTLSFEPSEANAARGVTIASVRAAVARLGDIIKVVPRAVAASGEGRATVAFDLLVVSTASAAMLAEAAATTPEHVRAIQAEPTAAAAGTAAAGEPALEPLPVEEEDGGSIGRTVVRVELGRLDELQTQLSRMIVSRFRLEREIATLAERGHDVRALRDVAEVQRRELRDLRRAILRARLVRAAEVLDPLNLLVRRAARSSNKEVRLALDTGEVELDKAVADQILPALVHLVRNAVDHGLEPADAREAAGKPRAGTVRISCRETAGNFVEIEVADDGRGIDRDAVAQRAGKPAPDDDALLDLITAPGFSTRAVPDATSGRGLGMDIVRRIVNRLGGELSLATQLGAGTTFLLRVPVTIAVIDVFSFTCGTQPFVVPVAAIEEIFELEPEHLLQPPASGSRVQVALLERRGRAIPVVSLGAALAIDAGAGARKALVIRRNGELIAFTVDRMLGRQEVVVRPLEDPLVDVAGIAGATDLGDGRPTLVLDLAELSDTVEERPA